jgi:hypothetical protein
MLDFINKSYLSKFLALAFSLAIVIYVCDIMWGTLWVNQYIWHLYFFVSGIMIATHFITKLGFGKTPYDAQNFFMLSSGIKLFLSMGALFCYFYFIKKEAGTFLLNFFILYFAYTFFEIKTLLLSLQPDSKADQNK